MTESARMWNRHLKQYVDPELEKSAVIIFVEFCSDMLMDAGEAATLVKQRWSLKPPLLHLSDDVAQELALSMGIEPAQWDHARGADLLAGRVGKRVFVDELRYCESCLKLGNHSTLFQLPQVVRCPVHDEQLRLGCPFCGRPIATTALALVRNHLYCGACDRNLATERRRTGLGGPVGHPLAQSFAPLRRMLAEGLAPGESRSVLRWSKSPCEVVASAALIRLNHAHTVWSDPPGSNGALKFKTEMFRLEGEAGTVSRTRYFAQVRGAAIDAFEELGSKLSRYVRLKELPSGVEEAMHSGARVDLRVSTVAAAFWCSAAAFGVHRFVLGEMPPPAAKAPSFCSRLPEHIGAMRHVVRSEAQALFVRSLMRMRALQYGVEVAWGRMPHEELSVLPWRLRPLTGTGYVELQIRTRVDGKVLEGLAARYRRHWLLEVPEDASTLALVNSSRSGLRPSPDAPTPA